MVYHRTGMQLLKNMKIQLQSMKLRQYYYNLAFRKKGMLCESLFFGSSGTWTLNPLHYAWLQVSWQVSFFYYTNRFDQWSASSAVDSMVLNGYRPEILNCSLKLNLLMGISGLLNGLLYPWKQWLQEVAENMKKWFMILFS